ncbi:MAG: hypothetical protein KAJ03_01815 [Gammaproteobacteria bacterium]|nr:hypothetical protein [Gammaproteobacteria bacterium]
MDEIPQIASKIILSILALIALTAIGKHDYTSKIFDKMCDIIDGIAEAVACVIEFIIFIATCCAPFALIWII